MLQGRRPSRATGAALAVALHLIDLCAAPQSGGRVMLVTGGACTLGPGAIVSTDLSESIRTHKDLLKGSAPYHAAALAFYDKLAERLVEGGQCLDVLACSLDQVRCILDRQRLDRIAIVYHWW